MLNEFAGLIHENAKAHGWWEFERSRAEVFLLFHSEISEALEEYRDGHSMIYYNNNDSKPEGIAVELCDCVIRILDYADHCGIDSDSFMAITSTYSSVPDDLVDLLSKCHVLISQGFSTVDTAFTQWEKLFACVSIIDKWLKSEGVGMIGVMHTKHNYNVTRPWKHGGKKI